jgi:predicted ester cyclase
MPAEANRNVARIARRFFDEVFNQGNLEIVDEIFAPDYVGYSSAAFGKLIEGPEGIKEFVTMYRAAFPDIHFEFEELIATDDKVVARWATDGTHNGELQGIQPTGRRIRVRGIGMPTSSRSAFA